MTMSEKKLYKSADKYSKKLKKMLKSYLLKLNLITLDELNIITNVNEVYQKVYESNYENYLEVVDDVQRQIKGVYELSNGVDRYLVLNDAIALYNPVTGYRYDTEFDRKRARLVEGMLAVKFMSSGGKGLVTNISTNDSNFATQNKTTEQAMKNVTQKALNLLYGQSKQFGITVTDETVKSVYKANGIEKVKWMTEKDERVCSHCKKLDGKIFKLEEIPPKPHHNCRCWYEPVIVKSR